MFLNIKTRHPPAWISFYTKKNLKRNACGPEQFSRVPNHQEKPIEHTLVCFGAMGGLWSFFQKLGLNLTTHSTLFGRTT